jgi:hypothetical protein
VADNRGDNNNNTLKLLKTSDPVLYKVFTYLRQVVHIKEWEVPFRTVMPQDGRAWYAEALALYLEENELSGNLLGEYNVPLCIHRC